MRFAVNSQITRSTSMYFVAFLLKVAAHQLTAVDARRPLIGLAALGRAIFLI